MKIPGVTRGDKEEFKLSERGNNTPLLFGAAPAGLGLHREIQAKEGPVGR